MKTARVNQLSSGFSLIELLISLVVLLVVFSAVFGLFADTVRLNKSELTVADHEQIVKNALTLMATEIEQAGSNPDPKNYENSQLINITAALAAGSTSIPVSRTEGLNIGNRIVIDPGGIDGMGNPIDEEVTITSVTRTDDNPAKAGTITITPPLANSHVVNIAVRGRNLPIRGAILYAPPTARPVWSSDGNTLRLYGDINDNGAFYYSEYRYERNDGCGCGRIVRVSELLTGLPLPANPPPTPFKQPFTLLTEVVDNPDGTPLFRYVRDDRGNIASVLITVTVRPRTDNPRRAPTSTYRLTVTSRNVTSASTIQRGVGGTPESNAIDLPAVPTYVLDLAKWPNS